MDAESDALKRAFRVAAISVVALGVVLRVRGIIFPAPGNSLWLDEAQWALRLIKEPLSEHLIRPIAFMGLTKLFVRIFGAHDFVFRLLPWASGVATTLMALPIARRLFRSEAARLLFVSVLALDPAAIDLSKDFKPYAVGLALHSGMLLAAVRYRESGSKRDLAVACALIAPSVLFAQDALFAYPGVFIVMGFTALRAKRMRHIVALAGTAIAALALIAGLYFFIWSRIEQKSESQYWGAKYDVFYIKANNPDGKADWFLRKYAEVASSLGERRDLWSDRLPAKARRDLRHIDEAVWLALHIAGLTVLVRGRKFMELLLLALPIGVMSAFNLKGFWPFGVFRANLFTLVYLAGIAASALEREPRKARAWDFAPAAVLVLLPLFLLEKGWHQRKQTLSVVMSAWFEESARELIAAQGEAYPRKREMLVVDNYTCNGARYYTQYNASTKDTLGAEFGHRFVLSGCQGTPHALFRAARRAVKKGSERAWMMIGGDQFIHEVEQQWPHDLVKGRVVRFGDNEEVLIEVTRAPRSQEEPVD